MTTPPPSPFNAYRQLIHAWLLLRPTKEEHVAFVKQLSDIEALCGKDAKKLTTTYEELRALLPERSDDRAYDWRALLTTDD